MDGAGARGVTVSIILPVLDEAEGIAGRLATLEPLRHRGAEAILVDGGSADATLAHAAGRCDTLLVAPRGRAAQMNAGAARARGDILLFLHADTRLPDGALEAIADGLKTSGRAWGRFDVEIEGRSPLLPLVGAMMNLRSRLTGIATGDQAIFVRRADFERAGRFPEIPLMEDIALSRALRRIGPPLCLRERVRTSGRRWDRNGALRTILLMWRLRVAFYFGADPQELARRYGYRPHTTKAGEPT